MGATVWWRVVSLTTSQVVGGYTGVHCEVDGGVADAGAGDGVSGKAGGVAGQRRSSIGRSSVSRGSVVGGGIGRDSDSLRRNGGDWGMSGGGEGQSHRQ